MIKTVLFGLSALVCGHAYAQDFPDHISGDLGIGAYRVQPNVLGKSDEVKTLPYAYFDYGRFFARLDTFGVKTVKLGAGYLELSTRLTFDGMNAERGLKQRSSSVPIGIGTYQETPFGAFFLNAYYDANQSRGSWFEAIYAAEFHAGRANIYPQLGIEHRNSNYNNYFYGVSPAESAASGYSAYQAASSNNPILGLSVEIPIADHWVTTLTWRRKWLGSAVANSPIVNHSVEYTAVAAISYHFN
jgi:outer membrane protein